MNTGPASEGSSDGMAILAAGATDPGATNSLSPAKSVHFDEASTPSRPLSRKPTPFNQELSAEIRKAGLGAVFPDEGRAEGDDTGKDEGTTGASISGDGTTRDSSANTDLNVAGLTEVARPPKPVVRSKEKRIEDIEDDAP